MNGLSTPNGGAPVARDLSPGESPASATDFALGLQLCRASILSLTRLQLAFERGDRTGAMEAIDRLHALDAEVERTMRRLPAPAGESPRREALARQLREEKMAVAFDKLALASGVSGPKLASPPAFFDRSKAMPPPAVDPAESRPLSLIRTYGARAALLLVLAAGAVAVGVMAL